jgi:RNA recognition motif-containing protein
MEDEKKVYIGNLEFSVTEEEVRKAIEDKGISVKEVKIITDKFSGKSKGFGFAEFETEEGAQQTIDALNDQDLKGRPLRVSKARQMRPRTDRRDNFGGGGGYSGGGGGRFRR